METKICNKCKEEKEFSQFYIDKRTNKATNPCKKCKNASKSPIENGFKKCSKCNENKPINEYSKISYSQNGYRSTCNLCLNITINTITKICCKCGINKELTEFYKRPDSKDGYRSDCKTCKDVSLRDKIKTENLSKGTKICILCKIEKPLENFYKRDNSIDGYRNDCIECSSIKNKYYRENNKEELSELNKKWRGKNKDYLDEYRRKYNKENKEKIKIRTNNYIKNNLEKIKEYKRKSDAKRKDKRREYRKNKMKNDPIFRFTQNLRRLVSLSLQKGYVKKDCRTAQIISCSWDELVKHFENQFESWMNWDNQGQYTGNYNETWQIDHIIPINSVDKNLPYEERKNLIIKLNHYTNLRPLCSKKNFEKSDNFEMIEFENYINEKTED